METTFQCWIFSFLKTVSIGKHVNVVVTTNFSHKKPFVGKHVNMVCETWLSFQPEKHVYDLGKVVKQKIICFFLFGQTCHTQSYLNIEPKMSVSNPKLPWVEPAFILLRCMEIINFNYLNGFSVSTLKE